MSRKPARRAEAAAPARLRPWRTGLERPGSVLHGPPITITCACGERRELRYGEEWTCEECGRSWTTRQIPRDQYERLRRLQLRYRIMPVALGLFTASAALLFLLTENVYSLVLLLPAVLLLWTTVLRPVHRRRYQAAIRDLPTWNLRADEPERR